MRKDIRRDEFDMDKLTVTLSFDDGRRDTYTKAYAIMQKYNLLGTVHVITGYVDGTFTRKLSGSTGAMTIEDLTEMKRAGWEISSHGDQHITEKKDFLKSVKKLEEWGMIEGKVGFSIPGSKIVYENEDDFVRFLQNNEIAYMRGGRDKRCYKILSKIRYVLYHVFHSKLCYRAFHRYCFMNPENVDKYNLVSAVIRCEDKVELVTDLLQHHIGKKEWIIFMLHGIADGESEVDNSPWCWDKQQFTVFCECLKRLVDEGSIEVRTIMNVISEIE